MENNSILSWDDDEQMELPPGFRFHPTDEELITHYLSQKVLDNCFCARAIGEVDLNKCEPWDLPCKSLFSLFLPFLVSSGFAGLCSNFMVCVCLMKGEPKWAKRNGIFSVLETESTLLV